MTAFRQLKSINIIYTFIYILLGFKHFLFFQLTIKIISANQIKFIFSLIRWIKKYLKLWFVINYKNDILGINGADYT